jgi:hypothetical protein
VAFLLSKAPKALAVAGAVGVVAHRGGLFRGLIRNINFSSLGLNRVEATIRQAGLRPNVHFMEQLMKDPRTPHFGVRNLADLEKFFYKGVVQDAGSGMKALVLNRLAIVYDPKTGHLITIRPWLGDKGN